MNAAAGYVEIARRQLPGKASWTVVDAFAREHGTRGRFPSVIGAVHVVLEQRHDGGVWHPLGTPLEAEYQRSPSGTFVFSGRALPGRDDAGSRTIPPGLYRCRITSDYYQELLRDAELAPGVHLIVELKPGYAYPFPTSAMLVGDTNPKLLAGPTMVRGAIRRFDGAGVAATVELVDPASPLFGVYRTDPTGQWVVLVPDDVVFPSLAEGETEPTLQGRMRFTLPDGDPFELDDVTIVRGREIGLAQTAVRGWVQRTSGTPIAGATITIDGHPGAVTTGAAGEWFHCFALAASPGQVTVTATLPDGATSSQTHPVVDRAMTTVPTFRFP